MKSKTSCFNAGIFLRNSTRFWPVWGLFLGVLFFLVPVRIYSFDRKTLEFDSWYLHNIVSALGTGYSVLLVFVFCVMSAVTVFSYLYSSRSCNMVHAFPLKRSQLFLTNYLSGLSFLFLPQMLIALITVPGLVRLGVPAKIMGYCLLEALGYDVIFYSIAVFCCMLAGHLLSAVVYYFVLNGVYMVCKVLFVSFQTLCGYGLTGDGMGSMLNNARFDVLCPLTSLMMNSGISVDTSRTDFSAPETLSLEKQLSFLKVDGAGMILLYCVAAVLLVLFAFWLYRKRQLECAGEMSAFAVMNPIMRWIIAVCGGMVFAFFLVENLLESRGMLDSDKTKPFLLCFLLFSFVWFFVTEMILKKRFRVFGKVRWLEWAACGAVSVLLLCAINADAFHVVRYVPPIDQVRGVMVAGNYTVVADKDSGLGKVIKLHQSVLEHRDRYQEMEREERRILNLGEVPEDYLDPMRYLYITYYMKDGSTVNRSYCIPVTEEELRQPDSAITLLNELETPESFLKYVLGTNYPEVEFTSGRFEGAALDQSMTEDLYGALLQDIEEDHVQYRTEDLISRTADDPWLWGSRVCITLYGVLEDQQKRITDALVDDTHLYIGTMGNLRNLEEAAFNTTAKPDGSFTSTVNASFFINEDCVYTIEALKKYGLAEGPETIRQIQEDYMKADGYSPVYG